MSDNNKSVSVEQSTLRKTFYNKNDEIDLIDVMIQLWRGKLIIVTSIILMIILSVIYILTAKEKWTSTAIVAQPSAGQVANYNAALDVLYSQFPQDKMAVSDLQRLLFVRFSASISALSGALKNLENPLDLKITQVVNGQPEPISITFSAEKPRIAQQALNDYIDQVNKDVVEDFGTDIKHNLAVKKRELTESLISQIQIAKDKKKQRMAVLNQALKIAQAANIKTSQLQQAEYLSDDTLYLLGSDSLQAMISNEVTKPLTFDDYYYLTQRALFSITNLTIKVDNFQSYRYIMKSDLPLRRDSPKKSLAVLLAIILGGSIGAGIVLIRNMMRKHHQAH